MHGFVNWVYIKKFEYFELGSFLIYVRKLAFCLRKTIDIYRLHIYDIDIRYIYNLYMFLYIVKFTNQNETNWYQTRR